MSSPTPELSSSLGRYRIIEKIGAGGMGEVYRARDERLKRDVAVKVLPSGSVTDDASRQKFRREAQALSRLNHPHIATVFDFDTQQGVDFLVMEYIPGETLADVLAGGPMPQERVVALAIQLVDGLAAAHRDGIVHRDIKPGNLRITPEGQLKILDFGLAALLRAGTDVTQTTTGLGPVGGTLPYVAPEQLLGAPADPRADLYAAGVVLFEMATGKPPFLRDSATVVDDILHRTPEPPSRLRPGLDPRLETIILKCLEKAPERRYASAAGLLADLQALAAAPPLSPASRRLHTVAAIAHRGLRAFRHFRVSVPAIMVVTAMVLTFWVFGSRPALSFAARDWVLVTDFDNQTNDPKLDQALSTAFTVSLEQSTHGNVFPRSRAVDTLRRIGKPGLTHIDETLGREICLRDNIRALVSGSVAQVGSRYVLSMRLIDPQSGDLVRSFMADVDEDHLIRALDKIAGDLRRGLGETLYSIQKRSRPLPLVTTASLPALKLYADGAALWRRGQYHEGVKLYQAALQQDPDFAMAAEALASAYYSHVFNLPGEGKKFCDKALALSTRTTDRERLIIEASCQQAQGHFQAAFEAHRAYLGTYPDDASARYNFGGLLRKNNRLNEAIEQYKECIRIQPDYASAYVNLATSYAMLENVPEAVKYYGMAFALEPGWVTLGNLNHEYGFILVQSGDEAKATSVFQLALQKQELKSQAHRSLAMLDLYHGRYRSATQHLEEAVLINRAERGPLSESRNHLHLATIRDSLGHRAEAIAELVKAEKCLNDYGPNVGFGTRIGVAFARMGQPDAAARLLQKSTKIADPQSADHRSDLHRLEGEIELAQRNFVRARELLEIARQEDENPLTVSSVAAVQQAMGDTEGAIASYRSLLSMRGRSLGWEAQQPWLLAHYSLASLYASRGDKQQGLEALNPLLDLWKEADADAPLVKEVRQVRAKLEQ